MGQWGNGAMGNGAMGQWGNVHCQCIGLLSMRHLGNAMLPIRGNMAMLMAAITLPWYLPATGQLELR